MGYARVSTMEQDPALQINALEAAGCDQVFVDRGVSGKHARRLELDKLLERARPGDTLVTWKLDRLGRDTRNLLDLLEDLTDKGVKFRSLTEGIATEGPMGKAMLTIVSAFAELERDVLIERTNKGLEVARARGRFGGRPSALSEEQKRTARQLHQARNLTLDQIAAVLGVSKSTIHRTIKEGRL